MDINLGTPALLFPAISLLLLAYTNRFLAIASLIRDLHARYRANHDRLLIGQIENLRQRVKLIRNMQGFGLAAIFACVACMLVLFAGHDAAAKVLFGLSLALLLISLGVSLREIQLSTVALEILLGDLAGERAGSDDRNPAP